jgi:hypothetical protein
VLRVRANPRGFKVKDGEARDDYRRSAGASARLPKHGDWLVTAP